jgi:peptidylprolyl isomerase
MLVRTIVSLLLLCAARMAVAAEAPSDQTNILYLDLEYGRVVIQMHPEWAPKHVERIKHLVRGGFYDGIVFHRVIDGFMAQAGDPSGTGAGGSGRKLKAEFTRTPQVRGIVSMARGGGKDTADSQWFIVLKDDHRSDLDGKYTAWGEVISGMEFVDKIRKGDANRNGAVKQPDHIVHLQIAADVDQPPPADPNILASPTAAAEARDFSAVEFRCLAADNRPGAAMQAALAAFWTHGYLAGSYKAQNKLDFSRDGAGAPLLEGCKAYPQAFLLVLANQELAKGSLPLSGTTEVFVPAGYACKDYVAARTGANKAQADLIDLWGFAFIQGFKNVGQPNMEIPFEVRPQLLTAAANACAKTPELGFVDLMGQVAAKVKLK